MAATLAAPHAPGPLLVVLHRFSCHTGVRAEPDAASVRCMSHECQFWIC